MSKWHVVETRGVKVLAQKSIDTGHHGNPLVIVSNLYDVPISGDKVSVIQAVVGPTWKTRAWRRWYADSRTWSNWVRT